MNVNAGRNTFNAEQRLDGPGTKIKNLSNKIYNYKITVGNDGNIAYGYSEGDYGTGPVADPDKTFGILLFRVLAFTQLGNRWDRIAIGFSDYHDKAIPTTLVKEVNLTFFGNRKITLKLASEAEQAGWNKDETLFTSDQMDLVTSYIVANDGKEIDMTVEFVSATEIL